MTDQRQQLLQAILDNPEDDMARLVYADWLEENGEEERAEFIRVQCELHRCICDNADPGDGPYDNFCNNTLCRHCRLEKTASKLLGQIRIALTDDTLAEEEFSWLGDGLQKLWLEKFAVNHGWDDGGKFKIEPFWKFHRGFIEEITLSSSDWFKHAKEITGQHPIRKVTMTDFPKSVRSLYEHGRDQMHIEFPESWVGVVSFSFISKVKFSLPQQETITEAIRSIWPKIDFELTVNDLEFTYPG